MKLTMIVLQKNYAVVKLKETARIPAFLQKDAFVSITRTDEELSIVLSEESLGNHLDDLSCGEVYKGFRGLKIQGPLDFSLIGILSRVSSLLAKEKISIFAISTFNTDYIFVNEGQLDLAIHALKSQNITIQE